jgi:hypothetical protein
VLDRVDLQFSFSGFGCGFAGGHGLVSLGGK